VFTASSKKMKRFCEKGEDQKCLRTRGGSERRGKRTCRKDETWNRRTTKNKKDERGKVPGASVLHSRHGSRSNRLAEGLKPEREQGKWISVKSTTNSLRRRGGKRGGSSHERIVFPSVSKKTCASIVTVVKKKRLGWGRSHRGGQPRRGSRFKMSFPLAVRSPSPFSSCQS